MRGNQHPSSRPNVHSYKVENLKVDEYGVLTGRFNWSGWDTAGNTLSNTSTVVGICRSDWELLGANPCLENGHSFYARPN